MFLVASSCEMRYSDILTDRVGPRTSSVTFFAYFARCRTACPAELPPPTTQTCFPAIDGASETVAP
jgi:hypothetical protein